VRGNTHAGQRSAPRRLSWRCRHSRFHRRRRYRHATVTSAITGGSKMMQGNGMCVVVVGSGPCILRSIVMTVRLFVPFLGRVRPFCAVVIVGSGSCVIGPIVMTVRLLVPFQWRVRSFCAATRSSAARSKKGAKRPQADQSDQAVQADNKRDGGRTKHKKHCQHAASDAARNSRST
jgi:hypothetical protein